jgi:predicted nucleic acid-binding protein
LCSSSHWFSSDRSRPVLPVDAAAAGHYAIIASERERTGRPMGGFDALIAAICRSNGAALATRNMPDFDGVGVEVIDPWSQPGT